MKTQIHLDHLFFGWLLSLFLVFLFTFFTLPKPNSEPVNFYQSLANWDGQHFLEIAEFGYQNQINTPFFPLYPFLIRLLTFFTNNFFLSGLIINIFSLFLALRYLKKLLILDFNDQIAQKTIIALLIFPTSFFYLTIYSESLFLLLSILSFYFSKKEKYFLAGIFVSLASLTRLVGCVLIITILVDLLIKKKLLQKIWVIFLSSFGILLYILFLTLNFRNPFHFILMEKIWNRVIEYPWVSFNYTITHLASNPLTAEGNLIILINLIFTIFGLGLSLRAWRYLPKQLAIYSLLSVLLPLTSTTLLSIPRFLAVIFPVFILIAKIKNQEIFLIYSFISILFLATFASLFINGYWIS